MMNWGILIAANQVQGKELVCVVELMLTINWFINWFRKRLALLLQNTKSNHLLVAVSRWYGGSPLGSTRFKVIASCAKQILVANKSLK